MDFIDQIKQHSARVSQMKDSIPTEEATKMSLIVPFFQKLSYDVFNPSEFLPEFVADVGMKKGEKVDYAVLSDTGAPAILIECKWCGAKLDKHDSQLFRYFGTQTAKFAILTNGVVYKFYTDLNEENKMDLNPFLEIDLLNLNETLVPELKKFHKEEFDPVSLAGTASDLRYSKAIKGYISAQLSEPAEDFVKFITSQVYDGVKTQAVVERFTTLVHDSLADFITERMNEKLKEALGGGAPGFPKETVTAPTITESQIDVDQTAETEPASKIVTTEDEIEAFYAIKSILRGTIELDRISYRDTESYFALIVDSKVTHWVCRLKLDGAKKFAQIRNSAEQKYILESVDDLYALSEDIIAAATIYA
jgi:hypothetical protein